MEKRESYTVERANRYIQEQQQQVVATYRYDYHLMAPIGWINDPNGLVYFQEHYHVFYQYYPYGSDWGPMHWGHARTQDFLHWETLPVALAPDQWYDRDGCFSGSAIEKEGVLYLVYTGHVETDGVVRQRQCLAYSQDGIHFQKSAANPVIGEAAIGEKAAIEDFRDPKVFERDGQYYLVVASKTADERGQILLYQSDDLETWSYYSVVLEGKKGEGIMWECPDLFTLDGKDVLILSPIQIEPQGHSFQNISSTMACIGEMDWQSGQLKVEAQHELDFGLDFYAPQTLLDDQNRRIMIAWMQMWNRTRPTHENGHGWSGAMTLPRQLRLRENRVIQEPLPEVLKAINFTESYQALSVPQEGSVQANNTHAEVIQATLEVSSSDAQVEWRLCESETTYISLLYRAKTEELTLSRSQAAIEIRGDEKELLAERTMHVPVGPGRTIALTLFRDTASLEIFTHTGQTMTMTFYEQQPSTFQKLFSSGDVQVKEVKIGHFTRE